VLHKVLVLASGFATDQRKDAMRNMERFCWKTLREQGCMFTVEPFHCFRREDSCDAGTCADATSPRFVGVKLINIERERLQRDETGGR